MKTSRIVLTAVSSGCGKTLITCGLLYALRKRGYHTASFKCGPDYIDPLFHQEVLGEKSTNLDSFFLEEDMLRMLLIKRMKGKDIGIIEGVMGYYDGVAGTTLRASAFDISRKTKTPSVLIVDCRGKSLSVVAEISGFLSFQKDSNIKGVFLNRISPMLYPRIKKEIEDRLSVSVIGYLPVMEEGVFHSRHLGLLLPKEITDFQKQIEQIGAQLEKTLDWKSLFELADQAEPLAIREKLTVPHLPATRIAVAKDEAFCFQYPENLELLRAMGAEPVEFSPLRDKELPHNIAGLVLCGGYPELYAKQLSENQSMRTSIKEALEKKLPVMAECGGFMFLHQEMEGMDGHCYPMVGFIEGSVMRTDRLQRFGYIQSSGSAFGYPIQEIRGHEFHYFDSTNNGSAWEIKKPESERCWRAMIITDTMFVGFPHFYYLSNPKLAEGFLRAAGVFHEKLQSADH